MDSSNRKKRHHDLAGESAVAEVVSALTSARGMRDALVTLAMTLAQREKLRGYLMLLDPGLSGAFIDAELRDFKIALRSDIAERLHVVVVKAGRIFAGMDELPQEDRALLLRGINRMGDARTILPAQAKQEEVFLVILRQWVDGRGPMSSRWLEDTVGCNYRTVASAIGRMGSSIRRYSDRSISLKHFPEQEWRRFLAVAQQVRSTMLFADASDQPRSPESLLRRVLNLKREDVAVGGVVASRRYYGDLDIVGTPRLDLCIHCPANRIDLDFIQHLDPALERTRDAHRPARLAVHFIRRRDPLFHREDDGSLRADPIECLHDLYNARLDQQARSFQDFLVRRGRVLRGDS